MNEATVVALENKLVEAERAARQARGLPPWHLLDLNEFPFAFAAKHLAAYSAATDAWLAAEPRSDGALLSSVFALLAQRDYDKPNGLMERIQRRTDGKARMRFGIPQAASDIVLPEVHGTYPSGPAVFLACDPKYFEIFGRPGLLRSGRANRNGEPRPAVVGLRPICAL